MTGKSPTRPYLLFGFALLVLLLAALAAPKGDSAPLVQPALGADKDCSDFGSQAAAQDFFIKNGGPSSDPHGLDADGDGVACETNPCPCSTDTGGGGGGGGGGGDAPKPTKIKEKLKGSFRGIGGSKVTLKVVMKGGKLKKVKSFKFLGLPARCNDGSKFDIAGKAKGIKEGSKKFRSSRPALKSGSLRGVSGRITGKVKGNAKKAKGKVRVSFRRSSGTRCTTRARKWKAS